MRMRSAYTRALTVARTNHVAEQLLEHLEVLVDVAEERDRQDQLWGEQNLPDGTGPQWSTIAQALRQSCQAAAAAGTLTWHNVLVEEVAEAASEEDPQRLRAELVQVAAVAVQWIQAIDRRSSC